MPPSVFNLRRIGESIQNEGMSVHVFISIIPLGLSGFDYNGATDLYRRICQLLDTLTGQGRDRDYLLGTRIEEASF